MKTTNYMCSKIQEHNNSSQKYRINATSQLTRKPKVFLWVAVALSITQA